MPSKYLILCHHPLLLLPSIFPIIRVFSYELALYVRWSKYWSFSFSISPSYEYSGLISFNIDWFDLLPVQGALKSLLHTTFQKHQFLGTQHSCGPTLTSIHDSWKNHSYRSCCQQSDVSAYLRLLIFLLAILIPACNSSSLAFLMMYSAYKLNKQVTIKSLAVILSSCNLELFC